MKIAFFGSSLVSAYWNGAATYYRGIIRALNARGHRVTFYEPDAFDRQRHRDIDEPEWAKVRVYEASESAALTCLEEASDADVIVKASGVGVLDAMLEDAIAALKGPRRLVVFWDVDAPATLDRLNADPSDPLRALVPRFDAVLTYGGGEPVTRAYEALGARACVPIYNALDPHSHHPVGPDPRFRGLLGFLGNRLPDREQRVERFFLDVASRMPRESFVLGGAGWGDKPLPANVRYVGHVYTADHNAFNVTPAAVLNVSRESMARYGHSPATRVFEACGAGACLITDAWEGIDRFLEPGREVLVADDGDGVAAHLSALDGRQAAELGERARRRVLSQHTYGHRAVQVEEALGVSRPSTTVSIGAQVKRSSGQAAPNRGGGLHIVFLGLAITSSWGNGHATTYRGLVRELARRGHEVQFLERDTPWYADSRDLPSLPEARVDIYRSVSDLKRRFASDIASADAVIVGSYVPDGREVADWVVRTAKGVTAFYDIDTPVTALRLEARTCEYLTPELVPRFDLYLSFTGGPILRRLEQRFGARKARPLYCSADPDVYYPEAGDRRWDLGYMGTYSDDRQPALERLLLSPAWRWREGRFVIAGAQYPSNLRWPGNVERVEHLPPSEHRAFYNAQRCTLNVTRRDMVLAGYSPSVRLFEAAACGCPILSDDWSGLGYFFEIGSEILLARSAEEVLRHLRETDSLALAAIGRRAREKVLARHTPAHRAESLERYLREVRGEALASERCEAVP